MSVTDPQHDFVDAFADFWSRPAPNRLDEILHADVVLRQPLSPPLVGLAAAEAEFERLWSWTPDLRAHVERWQGDATVLFIEIRLSSTMASRSVEWGGVDRFLLRGAKAVERISYFDPIPLVAELPRHPSEWWSWWRSGAARPWSSGRQLTRSETHPTKQER
ncbi:nuclear transport factor 2 family protein [Rhodococcus qingshengii]|nr:nuclear transport factor 2 family protein [Rhodococcus qingshengii]MBS3694069.1 nuclear transport factor 2 family protein [Rhodococcus qingshengii]